jgi:hypothetical protein
MRNTAAETVLELDASEALLRVSKLFYDRPKHR